MILWITLNSFALFVNLADIEGRISDNGNTTVNLFTATNEKSDFWPFTTYYKKYLGFGNSSTDSYYFQGIFNSYDLPEYIFYVVLGISIVYIPKVWRKDKSI